MLENNLKNIKKILDFEDWENLEMTANEILKNATRDLVLWTNVKKEIEKEKKRLMRAGEGPKKDGKKEKKKNK